MNVFWLDDDPRLAARYHDDRHVNKMLLEAAQVLCTTARLGGVDAPELYSPTHVDHPITRWAGQSKPNWLRLRRHAAALNAEFCERFDHESDHASWTVIETIDPKRIEFSSDTATDPPQVMPERYRRPEDLVGAYRAYYATEKAPTARWRRVSKPPWIETDALAAHEEAL